MLHHVGHVHLGPRDARLQKGLVEQPARRSDERLACAILGIAGLLSDQHDACGRETLAKHRLRRVAIERSSTRMHRGAQCGQRLLDGQERLGVSGSPRGAAGDCERPGWLAIVHPTCLTERARTLRGRGRKAATNLLPGTADAVSLLVMLTPLASLLLLATSAMPAAAGADFKSPTPRGQPLAVSNGSSELMPQDDVVFLHDSSALSESAYMQLDSAAKWLRARPSLRLVLEGYADHTGGEDYNEELAARRANTIRQHLIGRGVSGDRIIVAVYGGSVADPRGSSLDRRVILYVSNLPTRALVTATLDKKRALSARWTEGKVRFTETRGTSVASR